MTALIIPFPKAKRIPQTDTHPADCPCHGCVQVRDMLDFLHEMIAKRRAAKAARPRRVE